MIATKKEYQESLYSEEMQEILDSVSYRSTRLVLLILLGFLVLFLVGSFFLKKPHIIIAPVTLTSQTPPVNIIAKTSGRIAELYVKDQAHITAGTPIALIENAANEQDIKRLESILSSLPTKLRIQQPYLYPQQIMQLGELQGAYGVLQVKIENYNQFISSQAYQQRLKTLKQALFTAQEQYLHIKQQLQLSENQYELQVKSFTREKALYTNKLTTAEDFEQAEKQLLLERMSKENTKTSANAQELRIAEIKSEIVKEQIQHEQEKRQLIIDLQATIEQLQAAIATWRMNYLLCSPIQGKVSFNSYWAESQNVEAGKVTFTVIPQQIVETQGRIALPAAGSGKVKIGQSVQINFDNYPEKEFGLISGTIKHVSLVPDENNNYIALVVFPTGLNTSYGKALPYSPQMKGVAKIVTEDMRLLESLILPLKSVLYNN